MKIGHRETLYTQTFLVPSGESATDSFQARGKTIALTVTFEDDPKGKWRRQIRWTFEDDGRLHMIFGGPFDIVAVSQGFVHLGELDGQTIGFLASFSSHRGLHTLQLHILLEAAK